VDVYVKPVKKASFAAKDYLFIRDVAKVSAPGNSAQKIGDLRLMAFGDKKSAHLITAIDFIKTITKAYPDATVSNVGETDTIVGYSPKPEKKRPVKTAFSVAFVALSLFIGSSTAIMSFHTDGEIPKIFGKYYEIFFDEKTDNPYIINIPYAVGLALGIVVFFNHIGGRRLMNDPTPIEVQMTVYDQEVTDTLVETLSQNKAGD
jgi:stage V sporulation protein AA